MEITVIYITIFYPNRLNIVLHFQDMFFFLFGVRFLKINSCMYLHNKPARFITKRIKAKTLNINKMM